MLIRNNWMSKYLEFYQSIGTLSSESLNKVKEFANLSKVW